MGLEFKSGFHWRWLRLPRWRQHWLVALKPQCYGSGRAALIDIARQAIATGRSDCLLLPDFQCDEVYHALAKVRGLRLLVYPLGKDLLPKPKEFAALLAQEVEPMVLLVDYFASTDGAALEALAAGVNGLVIWDLVHSFPRRPFTLGELPANWLWLVGYRKLFWKGLGVLVIGSRAAQLPRCPWLIAAAVPAFPRSLSLCGRFGILSVLLRRALNWQAHVHAAASWASRPFEDASLIARFNAPVRLAKVKAALAPGEQVLEAWPSLSRSLSPALRQNAEERKAEHLVVLKTQAAP